MVNREEVKHIADLSMLNLSEEEITMYTTNMQDIVEFANQINELDTEINLYTNEKTITKISITNGHMTYIIKYKNMLYWQLIFLLLL